MFDKKNMEAWSLKESVEYYVRERTHVTDLYKSEASMLLPVVPHVRSVLDVGCAVGNTLLIFKELNPDISYVGVDIAEGMIDEARRRHPGVEFHLGSGDRLPFEDGSFDLVFCTGVLHHNPEYQTLLDEVFRVARRFAVVDLPRVVIHPYQFSFSHSYMELQARFSEQHGKGPAIVSRVPYVLANAREVFQQILDSFSRTLSGFACCGYYGKPHPAASVPLPDVIFTVVLLVKGLGPVRYCLNLPEDVCQIARDVFSAEGTEVESIEKVIG